jgi:hypothetical protein
MDNLQEMASGFGALLARQLESFSEDHAAHAEAWPVVTEKLIDNRQIIDYLEDCRRKQQWFAAGEILDR